ncbi:MAG: carbon-nitrogen hydrolase family protein, partial [Pseudomonadales bacterium]|nr:carbon-nitrogen hydrolase family protein [Pseudomonadales bacterium]
MKHKVAAVQMVSSGNVDANLKTAQGLIEQAAADGAELVLLPEVFAVLEGGPMRPFAEEFGNGHIQSFLAEQARQHEIILIGGTIPLSSRPNLDSDDPDYLVDGDRVRPASLVFGTDGACLARYDKMHLFDVSVNDSQTNYSESRSYEAGDEIVCVDTELGRLGLSVCYDLRFPELYRELFRLRAELVTVPSAFTRVTGAA